MSNTVLLCWVLLCVCLWVSGPETYQTTRNEIKAINYFEMNNKLTDTYYLHIYIEGFNLIGKKIDPNVN
jgi:hypothetical protein